VRVRDQKKNETITDQKTAVCMLSKAAIRGIVERF
jgi:hypothetical protein